MMSAFSSNPAMTHDAWVLHSWRVGETSLQVALLTRDAGICIARYPGANSQRKRVFVQPFTPFSLSLSGRFIRGLEPTRQTLALAHMSLYAAMYVNELAYRLVKPKQVLPALFDAYDYVLFGLSQTTTPTTIESLLRQFEWRLLTDCGYGLHFAEATKAAHYQFIPSKGFVPSKNPGIPHDIALKIVEGCFDILPVLVWAKPVMRKALDHALGGKPLLSRQLVAARLNHT